jgi:hypothetical protein
MDPIFTILSKIIRYKGLFVSQCMRRLTVPDNARGPSACVFPNPVELNARDDAKGGLRCEASGPHPQQ